MLKQKFGLKLLLITSLLFFGLVSIVFAVTNIDSTGRYTWNDVVGWIDFYSSNNVQVYDDRLEGYADSPVGPIALNCNTTPNGNICSGPAGNWKVNVGVGGYLSGWAWNDAIGWISFSNSNYYVRINGSTKEFEGWAWNDVVGWISFNSCVNSSICPPSSNNYKVKTTFSFTMPDVGEFESGIINANRQVNLNTIIWRGVAPPGTKVSFKITASNNIAGPWVYFNPRTGVQDSYFTWSSPGVPLEVLDRVHFSNKQYFRYKIELRSNLERSASPRVDDVILNWSQ